MKRCYTLIFSGIKKFHIKRLFLLSGFMAGTLTCPAQENLGIVNSNYAGTNGLFLNPAHNVDSKIFLDVNLAGLSAFVNNNYIYMPATKFYFWQDVFQPQRTPKPTDNFNLTMKRVNMNASVMGPSASLTLGSMSFGVFTRMRAGLDAYVAPHLAKFIWAGFKYQPQLHINYNEHNNYVNQMSWFEYGASYGMIIRKENTSLWTAGVNVKRLVGISDIAIDVHNMNYVVVDSSNIRVFNFDGDYGVAWPAWGAGRGWGADFGIDFRKMPGSVNHYNPNSHKGGCRHLDYKYKLGFSLLDVGRIKFDRQTFYQQFYHSSAYWADYDTTKVRNFKEVDNVINNELNSHNLYIRSSSFTAWLPLAASAQFDYNFGNNIYLNSTAIYGFRIGNNLRRGGLVSFTPRYELKRFEIAVPISLFDFRYPQYGLALRIYDNFVIGTDRIAMYLFRSDVYGMDIYFNLKFGIFKNPSCNKIRKRHYGVKICPSYF